MDSMASPELKAAHKLMRASIALFGVVDALGDVGGKEADSQSAELMGTIKVLSRWELEYRRAAGHTP